MTTVGWECPRCHRCYAPHVDECKACAMPDAEQLRAVQLAAASTAGYCKEEEGLANLTRLERRIKKNLDRFDWSKL